MIETIEDIEKAFDFSYPELYKELCKDNMLDWGLSGNNWYNTVFPKLKQHPPLLLFGKDIEIWDPMKSDGGIREMIQHEVYDINTKYRMVPFAKNGAGDLYVFQFDMTSNGEVPVSFFSHDCSEAQVVAKNLQDFIFNQLLELLTEIDEYSMFDGDSEQQIKLNLHQQLESHRKYLTARQISILEKLHQRAIFDYTYKVPSGCKYQATGLLTFDELDQLIETEMKFEKLNIKFDYSK